MSYNKWKICSGLVEHACYACYVALQARHYYLNTNHDLIFNQVGWLGNKAELITNHFITSVVIHCVFLQGGYETDFCFRSLDMQRICGLTMPTIFWRQGWIISALHNWNQVKRQPNKGKHWWGKSLWALSAICQPPPTLPSRLCPLVADLLADCCQRFTGRNLLQDMHPVSTTV